MTPRIAITLVILALVLAALSIHRMACAPVVGPYATFSGRTMGTTWEVKVAADDLSPDDQRAIGAAIGEALDRVNGALSTWQDDSEISRFNALASTEPVVVGDDLMHVLLAARDVSEATGGAFDVTVGPLVEAWGFGRRQGEPDVPAPGEDALAEVRARVGHRMLEIDQAKSTLRKARPDLEIDVSAIAKGHGVDAVAEAIEALGHEAWLVEIGGELRAKGVRLDGEPFRVAIEEPDETLRRIHRVIELRDVAMATSGDYRNWRDQDGRRISHTIDPRVGRPIGHALASVTVLAPTAMEADAWATALNVLGPGTAQAFAERMDLPIYLIVRTPGGGFETRASSAFTALLGDGDTAPAAASN